MSPPEAPGRPGRRLLLSGLAAGVVLVIVEIACFAFFSLGPKRFAFAEPEQYTLEADHIRRLRRRFDPVLGWAPRFPTPHGERPRQRTYGRPFLMAFGDSHTFCDEVEDSETWETYLAEAAGADVYNFGVGGYGPDQALLRLRQKVGELKTPVVALGVGLENINRVVNRYRPFYALVTGIPLPKPRFVLRRGALELLPNPVADAESLDRLADPGFVNSMGTDDYWYSRSGLPRRRFPYTALLFNRAIWKQAFEAVGGRSENNARPMENLWKDEDARRLFLAILDAFVDDAKGAGCRAVFIVQPGQVLLQAFRERRGIPGYRRVMDHCAQRGYTCFDGIASLANDPEAAAHIETLSRPGGHLSPLGNRILAVRLHEFLQKKGLTPSTSGEDRGVPGGRAGVHDAPS